MSCRPFDVTPPSSPKMTSVEAAQVQRVISRSHSILLQCLTVELSRAIACCKIVRLKQCSVDSLPYLVAAEATSAKLRTLCWRGGIFGSEFMLELMGRLEEELGGTAG
jgi:hypothetical protein